MNKAVVILSRVPGFGMLMIFSAINRSSESKSGSMIFSNLRLSSGDMFFRVAMNFDASRPTMFAWNEKSIMSSAFERVSTPA